MAQVAIGCRVPESIKTQIDEVAAATGQSRGAVMVMALTEFLGRGKAKTLTSTVQDLVIRMESLESRHKALASLVAMGGAGQD